MVSGSKPPNRSPSAASFNAPIPHAQSTHVAERPAAAADGTSFPYALVSMA